LAPSVHRENQGPRATKETPESKVQPVLKETSVQQVVRASKARQENRDLKGIPVMLAHKVFKDPKARREILAISVPLALVVPREKPVRREIKETPASKVSRVSLDQRETQAM
jgi:hypothetical protein